MCKCTNPKKETTLSLKLFGLLKKFRKYKSGHTISLKHGSALNTKNLHLLLQKREIKGLLKTHRARFCVISNRKSNYAQ